MNILPDAAESDLSTAQTQEFLTNLTAAITSLASSQITAFQVTDLYASNNPFDLSIRAGDHAFKDISNPLDTIWDGTAQTFPSSGSIMTRCANDKGWDRATSHRILEVNIKHVLEDSQSINKVELVTA